SAVSRERLRLPHSSWGGDCFLAPLPAMTIPGVITTPDDRLRAIRGAILTRSDFLAGLGHRGRPRRHDIGDAIIEPVFAAHDEVRAGEALRPHRMLDELRAAPRAEPVANRLGEAAVDRDAALAADIDARLMRRFFRAHREIDDEARHLHDGGEDAPSTRRADPEAPAAVTRRDEGAHVGEGALARRHRVRPSR